MSRLLKSAALAIAVGMAVVGGATAASADAGASAVAANSPGLLSGNVIQVPIHIPINVCGNTLNVLALLNPAGGSTCINS
ncbi:chaplin [Streptomyces sp. NPDC051555]|uniref:chaplin n=1 Tax=Streptomyces sp. NPDC051555 TaxID=3365657 RepID=UPI0037A79F9C